jgi:tRNA-2-methylthio-N6-dimethylallyladenosine synthase
MNEEDSEQMAIALENLGYEPAERLAVADVVLLNTCSVRRKPEDKAFSLLGELAAYKSKRPNMIIGVCGCMAQLRSDEIRRRAPIVDFVLGTGDLGAVGGLVEEAAQNRKFQKRVVLPERKGAVVTDVPSRLLNRPKKIKSFVPIQYGCDKFCTFCIVPTTRGRERSRPTAEIVAEVAALAHNGTKEVTLLGQTVNSYGKNLEEGRVPFSRLLEMVAEVPGIERIRYMSPYPRDFRDDLIQTIAEVPQVMEHIHMPLQSGHDRVLKSMRRLYSTAQFEDLIAKMRDRIPRLTVTTDIIVGFPGETEEEFEQTLEFFQKIRFDGAYMFIYSPRPGTPGADMELQVPLLEKKRRLKALIALQNQITIERNDQWVGKTVEVLVESRSPRNPEMLQGYSREYKMIHFAGGDELLGQIVSVKTGSAHLWGLAGELVQA